MYILLASEDGGAQSGDGASIDGVSPGSRRNVRVVHLRPIMTKHASVDNILAYTDL